jgi:hypothetical protein
VRGDPRFAELVGDLGLPGYWRGAGHAPDDPALARLART